VRLARDAAMLLGLAVVVGACGGPSATPTGAATATPSATPPATSSPAPTEQASPTATLGPPPTTPVTPGAVLAPGTAVEVIAVELNLRERPSTSSKRVSLLKRGDVVIVAPLDNLGNGWGPVTADGFEWYPVMQVSTPDGKLPDLPQRPIANLDGEPVSGWVAAGEGTRPYIRALPPRCPTSPTLRRVAGMLPAERLSCFGANPIVLEGTYGCPACGVMLPGVFEPAWLAIPIEIDFLSVDPSVEIGPIALRFPPDGPDRPPPGSIIRVTVHVHDPRAVGCSITVDASPAAITVHAETAELFCRERLVVDSYETLGTDPRFPDL
jgi:hypothetical protein